MSEAIRQKTKATLAASCSEKPRTGWQIPPSLEVPISTPKKYSYAGEA
jgi:hypothetical protein